MNARDISACAEIARLLTQLTDKSYCVFYKGVLVAGCSNGTASETTETIFIGKKPRQFFPEKGITDFGAFLLRWYYRLFPVILLLPIGSNWRSCKEVLLSLRDARKDNTPFYTNKYIVLYTR